MPSAKAGRRRLRKTRDLRRRIPDADDWRGYKLDLELKYAYRLFFGKPIADVLKYFGDVHSIQRSSELLFMPRAAFQYYVLAFADYVRSDKAIGDRDSASSFIGLLVSREKRDPGSVALIFPQLQEAVNLVSAGQERFDASVDIYGRFPDRAQELVALINS